MVRITSRTDIEGAIGSGIYRAFLAGTYSGWNLGESSNPQGIDVDNIYNFTGAPSLTVYRPTGKFTNSSAGGVWGHPLHHSGVGRCWPEEWDAANHGISPDYGGPTRDDWDGESPDCDNNGGQPPSCLRLSFSLGRFMEQQHDQSAPPEYMWIFSYLLLWQYTFQDAMPNNTYSVLFTPANIGYKSKAGNTSYLQSRTTRDKNPYNFQIIPFGVHGVVRRNVAQSTIGVT